jgi:DNA repair protein RadA/Sms
MKTTPYACSDCDYRSPRWFGRCPQCGGWGSAADGVAASASTAAVVPLAGGKGPASRTPTGMHEVDRVLGGGIVPGEVVLLSGEPGIGKSTLVLQLMASLRGAHIDSLLVSGEESIDQVALRAERLGAAGEELRASASADLAEVINTAAKEGPRVLIVDSIQTMSDPDVEGAPGSLVQVRECASALARFAKLSDVVVILVGHVTKDGGVAGPKTLEHLVDAVLLLEGERTGTLRLLRATKNRFGPCDETGVFTMNGHGLVDVADPSSLLLSDRRPGVAGSIVYPSLEGSRPMLVEIQALVTDGDQRNMARRVAIGLDQRRLTLLLAVLSRGRSSGFTSKDVFAAAAGGLSVKEPAADLAICLATLSAVSGVPLDPEAVAIGEVGLGGEVRRAPGMERRLAEAARHGFGCALVPKGQAKVRGIETHEVTDIGLAFGLASASPSTYASQGGA